MWKKMCCGVFVLVGVVALAGVVSAAAEPTDFYVSVKGDDRWQGTLPEPDGAGTEGPFATLSRAREAVRELVAKGLTHDVTVHVRGGVYYLQEPLLLTPEDSGTEDYAITYCAYEGEEAFLVGGVPLTGWQEYRDGIWQAPLPEGVKTRQVFENGVRMTLARTPKRGYHYAEAGVESAEQTVFRYEAGALNPEAWDIGDASVYIFPTYDWANAELPVDSIDPVSRTIRLRGRTDEVKPGNRYFVRNVLALLSEPGECQIDMAQGYVYCMPRLTPVEAQAIVASTLDCVAGIQGEPGGRPVVNVHIVGLNLGIAEGNVVTISRAKRCSISGCLIENGGGNGVGVHGAAQDVAIRDNLIRYQGASGVSLSGLGDGKEHGEGQYSAIVENNHIHHCGRLVSQCAGVWIDQSGRNRVAHNLIHHMPRYGTSIKGGSYGNVPGVTWENHWDYLPARDNLFAYNHIHHVNQDTQDTGAMESFLPGKGNIYDHNLIHDTGNDRFGTQSGLYLDDGSDYFTVTNNVVYGVHGTDGDQCIYAKGVFNVIANNILVVAPSNVSAIRSFTMGGHCDHHTYTHNIIAFEGEMGVLYDFNDWSDDRVSESDYNLLWKTSGVMALRGGPREIAGGKSKLAFAPYEKWRAYAGGRYDQHSMEADPLFMDPAKRDYRLKADSPAYALGFKPIDTLDKAGLTADFPKRFEGDLATQADEGDTSVEVNSIGMTLRLIQPGVFMMGSLDGDDDEKPIHEVTITRPFYMGAYEVTQEQYETVMGDNPSHFRSARRPVDSVSWEEASAFCVKLSEMEGVTYRLPTEAEWEYACRAGSGTAYYWGDAFNARYAWVSSNSGETTHEAGAR